jgi:chaperonin cofactor prefoldin
LILFHTAGKPAHRYFVHTELVLETLEPLPADRKCFRMINGVLVERTVKDVVPALKTNSEGLRKVLEDLVKQYNSKQVEMEKWKVCSAGEKRIGWIS